MMTGEDMEKDSNVGVDFDKSGEFKIDGTLDQVMETVGDHSFIQLDNSFSNQPLLNNFNSKDEQTK